MRRTATESQKRRIETDQITIRLGAGSRHKRHSSLRSIRLLENVALQAEILRIAIESAAADGDDLSLLGHSPLQAKRRSSPYFFSVASLRSSPLACSAIF